MFAAAVADPRYRGRRKVSGTYNLPAPTGGLNVRDSFTDMEEKDAVEMTNVFPEANYVAVRKGYASWTTGLTDPVHSLMTWNGLNGVDKLFAGAGTSIWTGDGGTASASVTGLTNVDFQWTCLKNSGGMYLLVVNGADSMRAYNGSVWSTPVITVATSSTFVNVCQFKERLWFATKDSLDLYYLPAQAIAGAAVLFPMGSVFRRGGYVIGLGSFSNDAGEGPDDYFTIVTNNGEVAVYQGTDPDSANTWSLVGRFDVGMPIGRRCTVRLNGDLGVITQDGVVSMQAALRFDRASIQRATITGKIQTLFSQLATDYKSNFGWSPCVYPRARYMIVNVPEIEDMTQTQLVMNTITGSWCKFTGMDAGCWGVANDLLYFGGNDGVIYQADIGYLDNLTDNIPWAIQTAWQMPAGATNKIFTAVRPVLLVGTGVEFAITVNVDFQSVAPTGTLAALAPDNSTMVWPWVWPGVWGGQTILDQRWQSAGAIGTWASVNITGTVRDGPMQANSFDLIAQKGGPY